MAVKRTHVIEPAGVDEGGDIVQNRAKAERIVFDLLGTLWSVGGVVRIVADRVKMGELPGGEPLAETVGMVIEFDAKAPMNLESITTSLLNQAYGTPEPPAPAAAPLADAVAVAEPEPVELEPDDEDDDDNEEDD